MRSRSALLVALGLSIIAHASLVAPARGASAPSASEVGTAVDRAKTFIYAQQKNGNWESTPKRTEPASAGKKGPGWEWAQDVEGGQWGGQTALAVLALIAGGENPQDPRLAPAVDFLKKADIVGTYALGVRCQVMLLLPETPENKAIMGRDLKRLLGLMKTQGDARGFYNYTESGKSYSLSRAQYAVLGVWAAGQAGQEVPGNYWSQVEKAWIAAQEADGGWRYQPGKPTPPVTAGITAVGVATLFIVQDQLYGSRGIDCRNPAEMPAVEKGIDWITKNFARVAPEQKTPREYPLPNLYAVERIGVAGGLKYFGEHDWYKRGAEYLLRKQRKDGSWAGGLSVFSDTCFGVLFLSRGRAPVIFNKLDYTADAKAAGGAWNRRPRDLNNLTRWIGRTSERDLNWQIMNLGAPLADWHDAPILYLSGSDPIKLGKEHVAKLRQYVNEGGMILAHADCGKGGFVSSATKLAGELFPNYEFRELPESHPIYTQRFPRSKWKNKPSVMGVSNGVRELMLLIPQSDPGKVWQIGAYRGREEAWQLGANIVFYAADQRDLRFKGETHLVAEDPSAKTSASVGVARLRYKGNWDPEPGGWPRLRNLLRRDDKLDLTLQPVDLGTGSLDGVKVAHLTGTGKLKLDEAAKAQLKKFVAGGGLLVVDAAGGAEAFASTVEPDLESLGTGAKLEVLPPDHSLFGGKEDPMRIAYRPLVPRVGKGNPPRLKAVRVGDRIGVLFSREDITAGLVGNSAGGVFGYTSATATDLMRRFVLRAAGIAPAATSVAKAGAAPATDRAKGGKKKGSAKSVETTAKTPAPAADDGSGLE